MIADNRVFNVNGESLAELSATLSLVLLLRSWNKGFWGFSFEKEKGLLLWNSEDKKATRFIAPMNGPDAAKLVFDWLKTEEAMSVPFVGWDADADHDGHNVLGWRAYLEEWGRIGNNHGAIVAIKPAYLWLGK